MSAKNDLIKSEEDEKTPKANCIMGEKGIYLGVRIRKKYIINITFAERIKKLRNDRNLTLDGLAKELGINKSRIGMWENNGTVPRDDILIQLSKYFNVSIDYLLGNEKMEDKEPDSERLQYLQRGLEKLDEGRLEKAEKMLSVMFDDIFENGEEDDDGI